jgi:uncharacterized pyridoxamine 5'-phosphate oxidase family protein
MCGDNMERVLKLLKENKVMTLATSSNDVPRSSIMEYVMVGNTMVFMTNPETTKGKNLAKNNKISLTVGNVPDDIMQSVYVAIDGTVSDAGKKEIDGYNKELFERYPVFKEYMASPDFKYKYFKVKFNAAQYSIGMMSETIKM